MVNRKVTSDVLDRMREMWAAGICDAEIAVAVGVSVVTVATYRKASGIRRNPPKTPPEALERMQQMWDEGLNDGQVGAAVGLPATAVRRHRCRLGVASTRRRYTLPEVMEIERLVQNGLSSAEVASKIGRTAGAVRMTRKTRLIEAPRIGPRQRPFFDAAAENARRLLEKRRERWAACIAAAET